MPQTMQRFAYPEPADRFYALVAGRSDEPIFVQNSHAIAVDDGSDDDTTRVAFIPRDPIPSLASLDFSDALRWMGMLDLIREFSDSRGWGPQDGFRLDVPVHPPYQRSPWLAINLTRSSSKTPRPGANAEGFSRDIGHFAEIAELRRRVEIIWSNDEFMVFNNLEEEDNDEYDIVLMGIPRRQVRTIMDEEFTMQDWLSMVGGLREAAARLDVAAYTTYMNVRPPYQHTPWVHVHLLAGGKAHDKAVGKGGKHGHHHGEDSGAGDPAAH